jgi:hypothetical protein
MVYSVNFFAHETHENHEISLFKIGRSMFDVECWMFAHVSPMG